MKALIIIDMLNDFFDGVIENQDNANRIIPNIQKLVENARYNPDWLVVYSNDAHKEGDRELNIWGVHSMEGTKGAEVIPAIKPIGADREIISPKRFYGAFDKTNLDDEFSKYDITEVVLVGQHTNCCVRHSAYGAFMRNYIIKVPSDAVCIYKGTEQENNDALKYIKDIYGGIITTTDEILKN